MPFVDVDAYNSHHVTNIYNRTETNQPTHSVAQHTHRTKPNRPNHHLHLICTISRPEESTAINVWLTCSECDCHVRLVPVSPPEPPHPTTTTNHHLQHTVVLSRTYATAHIHTLALTWCHLALVLFVLYVTHTVRIHYMYADDHRTTASHNTYRTASHRSLSVHPKWMQKKIAPRL